MFKKLSILILLLFVSNQVSAQNPNSESEAFFVNVFISANKTIYVETEKTAFENIENKVSKIIRNKPFKLDQKIVYRIFADENLDMGFIIDVNQEMLSAYNENVIRERYLLNTYKLNIDGQNWFESIDMKKLKSPESTN
ncbi:hypothetical protein [Christiangramia sp. SM2212]|uniref:Uncharacterized protein n=1 Tax=Christiangramia sediminicola TaxID=3073267 RepID=A0ABU1ELF5_9FLAO|nr:hypothetical protein [Christiangramia sp. SM2212]MDR5589093.1 hypothetical protein [Christiangramia sp. SM2212]